MIVSQEYEFVYPDLLSVYNEDCWLSMKSKKNRNREMAAAIKNSGIVPLRMIRQIFKNSP